jgi:uncharacterized membrane protein
MKQSGPPAIILSLLCLGFLGFLAWSTPQLPERVATHFGLNGTPNGWMTRSSAIVFMGGFGLGLPLFMVVLSWAARFLPVSTFNIPNREYWLAPERRDATYAFFSRYLLWLACLVVCFMAGLHWLTIQANNSNPVRMPNDLFLTILGGFLVGMAVWIVNFLRHFSVFAPD